MTTFSKKGYIILSIIFLVCALAFPAYKLINKAIDDYKVKQAYQDTPQEYEGDSEGDSEDDSEGDSEGDYEDDYEIYDYKAYEEYIEEEPESIEDVMFRRYGNYAVFKTGSEYYRKRVWVVFLRDEEMAIFVFSNDLQSYIQPDLCYEYEIRDNKLRFNNGFHKNNIGEYKYFTGTSAKIYQDGDEVRFVDMKQYGNQRTNVSGSLTDVKLPEQFIDYLLEYTQ